MNTLDLVLWVAKLIAVAGVFLTYRWLRALRADDPRRRKHSAKMVRWRLCTPRRAEMIEQEARSWQRARRLAPVRQWLRLTRPRFTRRSFRVRAPRRACAAIASSGDSDPGGGDPPPPEVHTPPQVAFQPTTPLTVLRKPPSTNCAPSLVRP